MTCYSPLKGYRSKFVSSNGKRPITFSSNEGYLDMPVTVACGQCVGCRLEYSRQWAIRCVHESSLYDDNCFITLTYDDKNIPDGATLVKKHYQDFMKRLRTRIHPRKVRYMACGEYGDKSNRPHYHAILFNYDFSDKEVLKHSDEYTLYESELLNQLWPFGYATVGSVTFDSAAYVARYVMKKAKGRHKEQIDEHTGLKPNERFDSDSGEIIPVEPEFLLCSRRPGIGHDWYKTFSEDVYPSDFCVINGRRVRVPRYYDNLLQRDEPANLERLKQKRKRKADKKDNSLEKLGIREYIKKSQLNQLSRNI